MTIPSATIAITSATLLSIEAITSVSVAYHLQHIQHHKLATTSATLRHNICLYNTMVQHLPL